MTNLIPISSRLFHGKPTQSVDAERFWTFLSITTPCHRWIERRIAEYQFVEGEDYLTEMRQSGKNGGRPKKHYFLNLDMAKELAMVERNEKGRQARKYFIECERKLKESKAPAVSTCQRVLAMYEGGKLTSIKDLDGYNIVKADYFRKLMRNLRLLQHQIQFVDGAASMAILDQSLEDF